MTQQPSVDGLLMTHPSLYFQDLVVGQSCRSAGRTVTEADIVAFAGLSGDYNQLHVDQQFAETTMHGSRIAHGMLVLSILSGLSTRTPLMQGLGEAIVGLAGLECKFRKPTRIGDTLHARLRVADLKPVSKGGRGLIVLHRDAYNQHDEVVLESIWTLMVKCRHPEVCP